MYMNRKMHNQGVRCALACLLLIFGMAWASSAQADVTYSGRAFSVFLNVPTLGIGPTTVSDTGELPPSGGLQTASFATVGAPGVLNAALLEASTSGANGVASSSASLADVVVFLGQTEVPLITASFVRAESEATCNGVRGSTEVANVTFGGQAIAVDPFAPNQTFTIPNPIVGGPPLATLIINEQKTASGGGTQDITVNAVHLTLATGDEVILSSAHSDVKGCPGCPPTPSCSDFVTGG